MNSRGRPHYSAGVRASLIAEVVFIAMVMMVSWVRGKDPWKVVRMPASFAVGPDAIRPPGFEPGDVLIGLLWHLWLSVLVGIIFAVLRPRLGVTPVVGGLITGGILYAVGFWILPLSFPQWLSPFWLAPDEKALQAVAHVIYGWIFGWAFARRTAAR